ncbi:MAG: hypothetical protein IJN60_03260 [Oscillospiraceae bacterium]|nr:hypothetical protein [Oscillospiraceae bacterium]
MASLFSSKDKKQIPATLEECLQEDGVVREIHLWVEGFVKWCKIIVNIVSIIGLFATIFEAIEAYDVTNIFNTAGFFLSLIPWLLLSWFGVSACEAVALLIKALAKIVQNTTVSANVALYESGKSKPTEDNAKPAQPKPATRKPTMQQETKKESDVVAAEAGVATAEVYNGEKICPECRTVQRLERKACWSCGTRFEN